jgi:thiamine biosynthesis lipoprotein
MGTYFRVTLAELADEISKHDLHAVVKQDLDRIDGLMSTYKADSEVSRFNRFELTDWFPVSDETATVVNAALEVFDESGGAFDITVAPLVDLWGFGPKESTKQLPDPAEINKLLATLGSRHLHVRLDPPALRKDHATIQIDLSGIAKGYAVDSVAGLLEDLGVTSYLVDIGGEMRACGEKAQQTPWTVAIERPEANQRSIQSTLPLRDMALATSGDYRNYFEQDGQRYSHEIDPRSGQPIRHQLVSASVLDPSCMRADAWATALIILGPEKGKARAEQAGIPAMLIVKDDSGFREVETTGFDQTHPEIAP